VQSDPETAPGALAPRPGGAGLAEYDDATLTGGAGLFDHSARDPFSRSAGMMAGLLALAVTVVVGAVLFDMNAKAFEGGRANGTPNQLAAPAAAGGGAALTPGSPEAEGATIIASKPCVTCHTIPGIPGATATIGPNLAGVARKAKIAGGAVNNSGPEDLKKWITDPGAVKPGTAMIKVAMTDDEATKIVAYLETLK
jgi:cytochrome c1